MKLGTRSSGVLLHPTSLPGPSGVGDIGPSAHRFAQTLKSCGQSWWQMLPVVPPGAGNSPYSAFSAFAGSPMLLSLETLAERGYLKKEDLLAPGFPENRADFTACERFKLPRLRRAFEAFEASAAGSSKADFEAFCAANAAWLDDYALFESLREQYPPGAWTQWDDELRARDAQALERARAELKREIRFQKFLQFEFDSQWRTLRRHCDNLGIGLIGDIPIFVAHDSSDVWSRPEIFWLDKEGRPLKMAGVPPDYFSKTGQLWGNPLYRWDALRARGYDWWISRFRAMLARFHAVRLDHFIGFHNYWEIPAGSPTAETGRWVPGPGAELFQSVQAALGGPIPVIAEDLGVVTQGVKDLRDQFGFPGLRVLQMAFGTDPEADTYKPHNYTRNCVAYTGTHDHDTTAGWFNDTSSMTSTRTPEEIERERAAVLGYLGTDGHEIHWKMIQLALNSKADTAILPMQDLLGLGSEARMNLPGTAEGNWRWRMRPGVWTDEIAGRFAQMTALSGRVSKG